jgi:hypothetical protein
MRLPISSSTSSASSTFSSNTSAQMMRAVRVSMRSALTVSLRPLRRTEPLTT